MMNLSFSWVLYIINMKGGVVLLGLFVGVTLGVLLRILSILSPAGLRVAISDGNSWFWGGFLILVIAAWSATWRLYVNTLFPFFSRWGYALWITLRLFIDGILTNRIGDSFPPALWGLVEQWQCGWSLAPAPLELSPVVPVGVPVDVPVGGLVGGPAAARLWPAVPSDPSVEPKYLWVPAKQAWVPLSAYWEPTKLSFALPQLAYGLDQPLPVVPIIGIRVPEGSNAYGVSHKGVNLILIRTDRHVALFEQVDELQGCIDKTSFDYLMRNPFAKRLWESPQSLISRRNLCLMQLQTEALQYPDSYYLHWAHQLYGPALGAGELDATVGLVRDAKTLTPYGYPANAYLPPLDPPAPPGYVPAYTPPPR